MSRKEDNGISRKGQSSLIFLTHSFVWPASIDSRLEGFSSVILPATLFRAQFLRLQCK